MDLLIIQGVNKMIGFIYVMSNPAHPGLIKIGQTSKDPDIRRHNLNSTGVPQDFKLEYRALANDYRRLEKEIHQKLNNSRYRQDREFFEISVQEAISSIRKVAGERIESEKDFSEFVPASASKNKGSGYLAIGIVILIFIFMNVISTLYDRFMG